VLNSELFLIVNVCDVLSPTPAISVVLKDSINMLMNGNLEFKSRGRVLATW
jgi:hypothetical protein